MMQALQQIEAGYQTLALSLPSLAPFCATQISQLRMIVPAAMSSGAGAPGAPPPSGGPTGPAISGMGQNPAIPPQPM